MPDEAAFTPPCFHYWMAAQGAVPVFIGIVVVYAWAMKGAANV